ncbi:MAG: hypothetical protein IT201_14625 [Thermoleophilia bacterium]|nr:hypothetical protein [Thermoleophilia bacterium]
MTDRVREAAGRPLRPVEVAALAVLSAVLSAFAGELKAGNVPLPGELAWIVPIAVAGIVTLVAYLPSPTQRKDG